MKWAFRVAVVLGVLSSGASFAKEPTDVATKLAIVNDSEVVRSNRSETIDQRRDMEAQIDELKEQVRALKRQLADSPKYFDDPLSNPLSP
jgi:uncharacterized protein involved in exopolysaccharide biosynthesis